MDRTENKIKESLDALDDACLGAEGVPPQHRHKVRESLNALRMLCTYLEFDVEATRRENDSLRAEITRAKNSRRKPKQ